MIYKTNWLAGLLAPLLLSTAALAVQSDMVTNNGTTLFIDNGAVYGMGDNSYGVIQPGSANNFSTPFFTSKLKAISIAAAGNRTAVLNDDGTARFAGYDNALYAPTEAAVPAANISDIALTYTSIYYVVNGQLFSWAGNSGTVPVAVAGGTNVKEIAAGFEHLVVLFTDGSVGTLGTTNSYGQLGNGTLTADPALVKINGLFGRTIQAGAYSSYVLQDDGTVKAFGKNTQYEFSTGNADNVLAPITIAGLTNVKKVTNPSGATIALRNDGTIIGCGWHNYISGALYNSSSASTCDVIPVGNTNTDISTGIGRVMLNRGEVGQRVGWSGNLYGSLGDGTSLERHQIVTAYFTPVVPAVEPAPVIVAVEPVPVPVVEPVVDTAIAIPFLETSVASGAATPVPTIIETVIAVVVDAIVEVVQTVVDAVTTVADTVTAIISPAHRDDKHENNGFGNGDQNAPGKSLKHNNAENSQRENDKHDKHDKHENKQAAKKK
jgi:hypothetical protein